MRYSLTILTFVPDGAPPGTRMRLPTALQSLWATDYSGPLAIIDDGSTDRAHLEYLDQISQHVRVVKRWRNGGISRAKNTCLRVISENEFDVGFIAEDDIAFSKGWLEAYLRAHEATAIHHFSWAWDHDPSGRMVKNLHTVRDFPIVSSNLVNGVLLSFTPRVISEIGGFKVLSAAWGHEHTNWTKRIIKMKLAPFFADIVGSNQYIGINSYAANSAISEADRLMFAKENEASADDLTNVFYPLIEY